MDQKTQRLVQGGRWERTLQVSWKVYWHSLQIHLMLLARTSLSKEYDLPVDWRMVRWSSSGVTNKYWRGRIYSGYIKIIVVEKLSPHSNSRFPIFIILRRGVHTERKIKLFHHGQNSLFEVCQTLWIVTFLILLETDCFLVWNDSHMVSESCQLVQTM